VDFEPTSSSGKLIRRPRLDYYRFERIATSGFCSDNYTDIFASFFDNTTLRPSLPS
jgi:hypothetical protein